VPRLPEPPKTYQEFTRRFPRLAQAWRLAGDEGEDGPLDAKTARLVKLGLAIGAWREGAVHSAVRKALAAGASAAEVEQVVALAAPTLGFPAAVAAFTWVRDLTGRKAPEKPAGRR
jgi:alkylhydroperoxidase/carboxymuconolactone decarboxylase family protein YurZ